MIAVPNTARKVLTRAAMMIAALALAACEPVTLAGGGGGGGPNIDTSAPVPVALLVPKSDSSAASVARSLENAARLAIADLDGARIDLRVYDSGGSASLAASQAQQAVNDGAKIILGPLYAQAANAAGVSVADEGVNVLSFSNNASIAGGNVFVLGATFGNTADRLMRYAARQGKRGVLIAYPDNVEGATGEAAIRAAASRAGVPVVGSEAFAFSQQGVTAAAPRIRAAARDAGADTLFLTSNSAGALPLLLQLLPEAGLTPASIQYAGLARWDTPPQTLSLPGAEGGWFAIPDQNRIRGFESRYAAAYGTQPHPLAGLAYDGIAAIGALVSQGKSNALTVSALTQSAGFQGVGGPFRLRRDGTNQRALAVATSRGGSLVILDPAPQGFGGVGY